MARKKWNNNAINLARKLDKLIVDHYLNPLGSRITKEIVGGLKKGKDIDGNNFKPLSDFTIKSKGHDRILDDSGSLKNSVRKIPATESNPQFEIKVTGKAAQYGGKHNKEGGFKSESGHQVPQRKWFGISKDLQSGGKEHKKFANEARLRIKTTWAKGK